MLVGLRVHVSPMLGEIDADRVTVPVKPLTAVIVRVVVLDWPALAAAGAEAVMVKSACFTVIVATAEWIREPLVPIVVSV